ncbi:DnaB-like helicase N-terminal domain-containing protein [Cellulomonas sp. URHD0024]|uniref:DnaB-like helicase N-terminal domain-containing protein n=1 Tax=Cellulomonas sp. URHD0024 TaxID=1302620 RepID=UPI0004124638|nr:DnaB-like helicase N-terminal domain-containing protein [Cellulomonas sp. URHD0024]
MDDHVSRLAEQATLGALLLQPGRLHEIQRWLRAGDFADPWHGQVYTAMLERHAAGETIDPLVMAEDLIGRLGSRRANVPRLADLLHVTPPHPDATDYARMVVDVGLRREIAGTGILLRAAAVQTACDRVAHPVTATCNVVDAALDCAASRWAHATGQPHDDAVVPLALRAAVRNTEARMGADKYLAAHPDRDPAAEQRHVIALIGALIDHPEHLAAVATWLPPVRVHDPGWRLVYGTAIEMAELGQRIDAVTIAWAVRSHAQHGPALPSTRELQDAIDSGWHQQLYPCAAAVAGDQVRHLADTGAAQLFAAARNPGVLIGDLVDTGHLLTDALRRTASVLPTLVDLNGRIDTPVPTQRIDAVAR